MSLNMTDDPEIILSPQQQLVLDDLLLGRNLLVTGRAGTGKSVLLHAARRLFTGRAMAVCGSTGVAAVNVGGCTLHSWAGIGLGDGSAYALTQAVLRNKPATERIRFTEVLALDEVSMISAELLDKVDRVFRAVRDDDRPFGGIRMLFFGDFLQLPPVDGTYAFKSEAWKAAAVKVHELTHVYRQNDERFAWCLSQIRLGILSDEVKAILRPRLGAEDPNPKIEPVYLTPLNREADAINQNKFEALPGPKVVFTAIDSGSVSAQRLLEKSPIPAELNLKKGSRVMCCHNLDHILGIMNGTSGIVRGFTFQPGGGPSGVIVEYDNGVELTMGPYDKEIHQDGRVIGTRTQIPLRPAHAVSLHKSQGLTLDKVHLSLWNTFAPSHTYLGLSRCTSLEGLFLRGFNKKNVFADPEALEFYRLNSAI